jgi:threonylcarbamoyladenosine tRNA methylthiotransferase MtaB
MTAEVVTFGCRLNALESEVLRRNAQAAGLHDAVIVNTCAVTGEAERQARQAIRRLRRDRPGTKIIVTGCAAQIHPDQFRAMTEVDLVLGNTEKMDAAQLLPDGERVRVAGIMDVRETAPHLIDGIEGRARAFVQVQNGCDHRCTFCIIPFGRGNSRSVPMGAVVDQVRTLVAGGYAEVVLTGVDVTSYGADLPGQPKLGALARRLLAAVPDLKRLRLTSLDVAEMDDDLWALIADEPRLMPHLHLSLQAGDDLILKRMKRRHSRADAIRACARARALRPTIALGADFIAGFPTETDAAFENTLALVEECGLAFLHVFPYSARHGTPAARMPQVPMPVRKERAERLRRAGALMLDAHLQKCVGSEAHVLAERSDGRFTRGHAEDYASVEIEGTFAAGTIVPAHVLAATGGKMRARPLI